MGKHLFELADYKAYNSEIKSQRAHLDAKWGVGVDSADDDAKYTTDKRYIAELASIVREIYGRYAEEDARLIAEKKISELSAAAGA